MRINHNKVLLAASGLYLTGYGSLSVFGMLFFSDHWGRYVPAAILLTAIGIFYLSYAGTRSPEKHSKTTYMVSSLIGALCVFLPHMQRATDGATSFTTEYIAYIALAAVGLYPYLVAARQ